MALSRDLKEFLSLLAERKIDYMLVGAHAVAVHGFPRGTEDVDFWLRRDAGNANAMLDLLDEFGFSDLGLSVDDLLDPDAVIQLGRAPHRIDLLTFLTGLDFDDCAKRAIRTTYEGVPVAVIGLADLISNKRATGRSKDLSDIEQFDRARDPVRGHRDEHVDD